MEETNTTTIDTPTLRTELQLLLNQCPDPSPIKTLVSLLIDYIPVSTLDAPKQG